MITITVANQKGGVAKTTTAITLAHGLALKGKKTLVVDLDPQGQAATILGLEQEPGVFNLLVGGRSPAEVIRASGRERLALIPGDKNTATAQIVLDAQRAPISRLAETLKPLAKEWQYLVLDTSPSIGGLQEQALWAADTVLIPTAVDYLAADGVARILETIAVLGDRHGWRGTLLGVLPTFYDDSTAESERNLGALQTMYGAQVLTPIHRATVLRECASEGKTVWEYKPTSRAAEEYARLLYKVLEVL